MRAPGRVHKTVSMHALMKRCLTCMRTGNGVSMKMHVCNHVGLCLRIPCIHVLTHYMYVSGNMLACV
jgi:hypothetical protein